jgi:hypothetical protein
VVVHPGSRLGQRRVRPDGDGGRVIRSSATVAVAYAAGTKGPAKRCLRPWSRAGRGRQHGHEDRKVFGWYDNEWGYTCRLADLTAIVGGQLQAAY